MHHVFINAVELQVFGAIVEWINFSNLKKYMSLAYCQILENPKYRRSPWFETPGQDDF